MRKPLPLLGKLIFDLSRCHQRVYIAGASPAGPKSLRAKGLRQFQPRIRFFIGIFPPSQISHWFFSPLGIRGILSRPSPHDAAHFWSVPAIQYDLPCFRSRERQGFSLQQPIGPFSSLKLCPCQELVWVAFLIRLVSHLTGPFPTRQALQLISTVVFFHNRNHDFRSPNPLLCG